MTEMLKFNTGVIMYVIAKKNIMIIHTFTGTPASFIGTGGTIGANVTGQNNPIGKTEKGTSEAEIAPSRRQRGDFYAVWAFNCSGIPENSVIQSVVCVEGVGSEGNKLTNPRVGLYANTTLKSSEATIPTTTTTTTTTGTNWNRTDLNQCYARLTGEYDGTGQATKQHLHFYGATLTVEYYQYFTIATSATGCTITPSGSTSVNEGDSFSVTIIPNINATYIKFDVLDNGIEVTDQLVDNVYTITGVAENHTITARAEMVERGYDVTTSGVGCTLTPSGVTSVAEGDNFTLSITPSFKRYEAPIVFDNGVDVSSAVTALKYKIPSVIEEHTITVEVYKKENQLYLKDNTTWDFVNVGFRKNNNVWEEVDKQETLVTGNKIFITV